ncbi:MAG: ROK family protein [Actinobacteria bacterium]|nr:ROK family protein [Actinomycetota bacterium]
MVERAPSLVCGIDLGGTKILGVVIDATAPSGSAVDNFGIIASKRVPTPHDGQETLIATLAALVADLTAAVQDASGGEIGAVGLGAPGLVDRDGVLHTGPNLPGIEDCPFSDRLGSATGLPVAVDNDATCAAWAEHELGRFGGHNHTLFLTLGTGIGAGITVKGQLLRGANGYAGEPGHMVLDPNGPPCPCGRRGCWERYASGSGLARLARDAAHAGRAPGLVELAGGDPEAVRGEHVTTAASRGAPGALEIMAEFGWWVALGIANLVAVLDSEVVIIGGGLVEAGSVVMDPIRAAFGDVLFGARARPAIPVEQASMGEFAGAIGAALLAAQRLR